MSIIAALGVNCGGIIKYLQQDLTFTDNINYLSIIMNGNKSIIRFSADSKLGVNGTYPYVNVVPFDNNYDWQIDKIDSYINISYLGSPKIYLTGVSEGIIKDGKSFSDCRLIGSTFPTGENMNFLLFPKESPNTTSSLQPGSSSSSRNNLPLILGITIPLSVVLLVLIGYLVIRKMRKTRK